jgi:hypothetical protein
VDSYFHPWLEQLWREANAAGGIGKYDADSSGIPCSRQAKGLLYIELWLLPPAVAKANRALLQ